MEQSRKIKCPVCKIFFELEEGLGIGATINCSSCDTDLEIVNLDPPEVEEVKFLSRDDYKDDYGDEEDRG